MFSDNSKIKLMAAKKKYKYSSQDDNKKSEL